MSAGGSALLLRNASVLTLAEDGAAGALDIAVEGGRFAAVGPRGSLDTRFAGADALDCRGRVALPGLINAHLHPEVHGLKGAVEEMGLHDWPSATRLNAGLAYLESTRGAGLRDLSIRVALADCALGGATCVATYGVTDGAEDDCARALRDLGLRGHVTVRDEAFAPADGRFGGVPHMYRLHAEERLDEAELRAAAAAHDRGERIVMHAAETLHRLELARQRHGTTTIRLLERYRLLSPRTLLSHAVHVDGEERALIAGRGAAVIASPSAEMKLADGTPPVTDYLRDGVTVGLGTDSVLTSNSNDLLIEARHLGLGQKLAHGPGALPATAALGCVIVGGADALGRAGRQGAIAPGLDADLVLLDTGNPRLLPLLHDLDFSNLAANVVYSATGQDVTDVMVGGRWIVRDRRLTTADLPRLLSDFQEAALRMHREIGD